MPEALAYCVLIVSYNERALLRQCLRRLQMEGVGVRGELIVLDNASRDGTQHMVETEFPTVRLVKNTTNLGFARAVNKGFSESDAPCILLLNPDAEISEVDITRLVSFLLHHDHIAAVGPRLVNPDGSWQNTSRAFPSPWTALIGRRSALTRWWPGNPVSSRYLLDPDHPGEAPFLVDWLSAACLLINRKAIAEVGMLDEGFFVYWDDCDWCFRCKQAGWKIMCVPQARAMHLEAGGVVRSPRSTIIFHRSAFHYYRKNHLRVKWHPLVPVAVLALSLRCLAVIAADLIRTRFPAKRKGTE